MALKSSNDPKYLDQTLAIMFETCFPYQVPEQSLKTPQLQKDYLDCWRSLKVHFKSEE